VVDDWWDISAVAVKVCTSDAEVELEWRRGVVSGASHLKHPCCGRRCGAEKLSHVLLMRRNGERGTVPRGKYSSLMGSCGRITL
jgi:hypothetical protein